jgi:hypothetical protein
MCVAICDGLTTNHLVFERQRGDETHVELDADIQGGVRSLREKDSHSHDGLISLWLPPRIRFHCGFAIAVD